MALANNPTTQQVDELASQLINLSKYATVFVINPF